MEAVATRLRDVVPANRTGPFVGPRPFQGADKLFFFGRERAAQELANTVAACSLTVVYGPSGAGKSSLLNTRLLDELERIEEDWLPVTFSEWQPGFENMLLAKLDKMLERGSDGPTLDRYAPLLQEAVRRTCSPIVLVFDQFEEYFLYHGTGAQRFEILLAQVANWRERGVHVVLSLRSDRLFLLDRLRRRIPHILQNLFLIDPLNAAGAADAILKPIESYNQHYGTAVGAEPALVDAVVRGADERQIFQRLPFRGRGSAPPNAAANGTEASAASPEGRIVAPFMQLALEALWGEDIEELHGTTLTLATLRSLASAPADAPDDALVGLLAQRHLNTVLSHRPAAEQRICAIVFDRMVTYSGGKVAVAVPGDFTAVLDAEQQQVAATLLEDLSADGPDRLVRRVATDSQRQYPGASGELEERFEIVHDALAVPILEWVTRWREAQARDEAAAREQQAAAQREAQRAAKRRIWGLVGLAAVLVVVGGWIVKAYFDRSAMMTRIERYAHTETQSQFRLPLLLGLASLAEASGPWDRVVPRVLPKEPVREMLRSTLLRSPRYGGTYRAAGLDDAGTRLARLVNAGATTIQLEVLKLDDGTSKSIDVPPDFADSSAAEPPKSVSEKLRTARGPQILVGFLAGMNDPVLYSRGMIYYRSREPEAAWRNVDVGQFLPPGFEEAPIMPWVELTAGAVQIITMPPSGNDTMVLRLRPQQAPDGSLQFATAVPSVHVKWTGQRLQPALSPWLDDPPHERFAYLSVPDAIPGQLIAAELKMGDLTGETGEQTVWTGTAQLPADAAQGPMPPTIPRALAFTDDGSAIAVRYGAQIAVVPLKDPARALNFQIPASVRPGAPSMTTSSRTLMAAARLARVSGQPDVWRFALLDAAGVVVLEGDGGNDSELRVFHPAAGWAPNLLQGSLQGSLQGLNGTRLRFSRDGGMLTLQQLPWGERPHYVRMWDLRPAWSAKIGEARADAALTALVCERADIDPAGRTLLSEERVIWSGAATEDQCPPLPAKTQ